MSSVAAATDRWSLAPAGQFPSLWLLKVTQRLSPEAHVPPLTVMLLPADVSPLCKQTEDSFKSQSNQ